MTASPCHVDATGGVVSLVPSITETLLTWGVDVAACTRFCEQPGLRTVGGTKNPDVEAIVALEPRVVFMDTEENREQDARALTERGVRVVATEVHALDDVQRALGGMAAALGRPDPIATSRAPSSAPRRSAVVPIWRRPWMVIGPRTYGASILAFLGIDVVPAGDERYPTVDPATLDADLVLVPSEPYEFTDRHLGELRVAMPRAEIRRVDGQDLFWWGARTWGAIERLERTLAV